MRLPPFSGGGEPIAVKSEQLKFLIYQKKGGLAETKNAVKPLKKQPKIQSLTLSVHGRRIYFPSEAELQILVLEGKRFDSVT